MISNFNEEAQEILIKAKLEMLELKHPYIGTEHLVLAILHTENELSEKLKKYNLTYNRFKKEIIKVIGTGTKKSEFFLYTPLLKKVIENAIMDSKDNNNGIVTICHLFSGLLDVGEGIAIRLFISLNLDLDSIYDEFTSKLFEKDNTKEKTLLIEELGVNISEKAKNNEIDPVIDRQKEINSIAEILLRRTKNNPLLIGPPGVGKTAIVEGLALLLEKNEVPPKLSGKKIISLDMASAVAGTKYRGEFEDRIKKILKEIEENEEIILFIDEIHTLIGAGGAEGAIDASNILKPALARGKIRCIGATTTDEYKKHFEKDKALERRFQVINIEEPSIEKTKNILYNLKPIYELYHNVKINNSIIDNILTLSEKYIYNRYRPDKQIDILDEVCSKVNLKENTKYIEIQSNIKNLKSKKEHYIKEKNIKKAYEFKVKETKYLNEINHNNYEIEVTINDVAEVINNKTGIPLYEILKDNKKSINLIENNLKKEIIGQEQVIKKLINLTKRIKLGYKEQKCLSILLVGPIGVGKTTTADIYSKSLKKKIIKINMSEYSDPTTITKFIGTPSGYTGYEDNKYLLNTIKDNPSAIIILNNIDEAHPKIMNLINQILEDSKITDAKNNIINLSNNIIIMTSNKSTNLEIIGFNNQDKNNYEFLTEQFKKSFINKIDEILIFNKLNTEQIKKIINNKINLLKTKYQDVNLTINNSVEDDIINEINYKEFGAKNIDKIIKNKIETIIIDNLINNNYNIQIDSILSK